jgi:murein DD-endopeptidase MepM/ murein hydrolase activator NlpD
MSKRAVEIDESLYQLGETKASAEHKTLDQVVEALLRSWLGGEPEDQETITYVRTEIYVVRPGDTLAKIAQRMYGTPQQYTLIAEHNGITDPGMIRVGQTLRIPFVVVVPASLYRRGLPFRFPLDKTETDYYVFGSLYASNSRWAGKPHPGVDFHQVKGANVYAIGQGTVLINRHDPTGYGHYLLLEHTLITGAKIYSLYAHLQDDSKTFATPTVGTQIQGQDVVIALEGETGYAGVPHLHFEIKKTPDLGLYAMINSYNLHDYFYDPYTFIRSPHNLYLPSQV